MNADAENTILIEELEGGVCHIAINRAEKRNAINQSMYRMMISALGDAEASESITSVLISGQGSCFTAGNDLQDFVAAGMDALQSKDNPVLVFLDAFRQLTKPIVLAVHGDAVGIGATMLLHADLVYASPDARFSLPFVKLGLVPEFASSYLLPRLAGHVKAFEWLILGEPFGAQEAFSHAVINKICDDPLSEAMNSAKTLSILPPNAVKVSKQLLKKTQLSNVDQCMKEEIALFSKALDGSEFSEAVSAFFERRRPDFSKMVTT